MAQRGGVQTIIYVMDGVKVGVAVGELILVSDFDPVSV
jgi:hypothetical protein